jgi:hypothetical protein
LLFILNNKYLKKEKQHLALAQDAQEGKHQKESAFFQLLLAAKGGFTNTARISTRIPYADVPFLFLATATVPDTLRQSFQPLAGSLGAPYRSVQWIFGAADSVRRVHY